MLPDLDQYPLPNICDFTNNLRGCKFFSKLDLVKGYNQVPMSEADICKTANVLVASRTRKLHIEHLRVVLELLVQNGLVLNLD